MKWLLLIAFCTFMVYAIFQRIEDHDNGVVRSFTSAPTSGNKGPLVNCSNLPDNRQKMQCMADNCLFDDPTLNALHCNPR